MSREEQPDALVGKTVASYRILARLGEGGMGVVYKAEHSRLRKIVALKFLRPDSLGDADSRLRFQKEARAAAALDHSSICPIYDFDDTGSQVFISMAYIEGRSLQERLAQGAMPVVDALLVAIQVAEGLAVAHHSGILHRDIKPSNIMLPDAGSAKIVDFGLARIGDSTRITRTGATVGTTAYMSPEQATGGELDARTDIWSLGVVLYEMVAGQPPFTGDYEEAVIYGVVHAEHPPLSEVCAGLPPELAWIVDRCLAKKPVNRYADCGALLADLRALRLRLSGTARRRRPSWTLANRGRLLIATFALLAVAVAIVLAMVLGSRHERSAAIRAARSLQVTSDEAWEGDPALAPDGSRIAYAKRVAGNTDIYLVNARGGQPLRLTTDSAVDREPCWHPDGSRLFFASEHGGESAIWQVDPMGGMPQLVIDQAKDPAISPDGEWLACSRLAPDGRLRIALHSLTGQAEPRLLTGTEDGSANHRHPSWSPDGKKLCYATGNDLWLVSPSTSVARRLLEDGIADDTPTWSTDGKRIYFSSYRGNSVALWLVHDNGRGLERLTLGSAGERHPSLSADGSRLAYATSTEDDDEDILIVDRRSGRVARLEGEEHDDFQPTLSAAGDLLAFVSNRQEGRNEIWLQTLKDGAPAGPPRRLTDQPGNACHPGLSPDGRWIAYYRYVGEQRDVWVVATAGGPPWRITDDLADDYHPAWSPDGSQLAFTSDRGGGSWAIWTVRLAAGHPAEAPIRHSPRDLVAAFPVWSPDGKHIAFIGHHAGHNYPYIVAMSDPETVLRLDSVVDAHRLRWNHATGELWASSLPTDGPLPVRAIAADWRAVHELDPPWRFHASVATGMFDIAADGHLLVYSRPKRMGNIWLLELEEGAF